MNATRFRFAITVFFIFQLTTIACRGSETREDYPVSENEELPLPREEADVQMQFSGAPAPTIGTKGRYAMAKESYAPARSRTFLVNAKPSSPDFNTEGYDHIAENDFVSTRTESLSTFSADVDTASYANVRRFIRDGSLPPADSVRIEEMINYFRYNYPEPVGADPFSVTTEVARAPWNEKHKLLRIGLKAKDVDMTEGVRKNLVFLLDVSGSMEDPDKLPLVKKSMGLLCDSLTARDRIAIVVYAGSSGLVLPPTAGNDKKTILGALEELQAGGSTNGGEGIYLAYKTAQESFSRKGINRVILATDGDFNVGTTSRGELVRLIEEKRKSGIELTVLGFGQGNLKDSTMEELADHGNGNYAYIDSLLEAKKVLVHEAGGTLITVAKDVKFQVEFNPANVESFRLIGYENRRLNHQDFNDDTKDAGEVGAGHTVTVLYEIVPTGNGSNQSTGTDPLRYQETPALTPEANSQELARVKIRYKAPQGSTSSLMTSIVTDNHADSTPVSEDMKFQSAVAGWGMLLRDSPHRGSVTPEMIIALGRSGLGPDPSGYRTEFLNLVYSSREFMSKL